MKNVKDPIAYIEVQESTLYSKVNGILGLNKDSMKRKGYGLSRDFCYITHEPTAESFIIVLLTCDMDSIISKLLIYFNSFFTYIF